MSEVHRATPEVAPGPSKEAAFAFLAPLAFTRKGSCISVSGLVQLPPSDGRDRNDSQEEADESERFEQTDDARLKDAPYSWVLAQSEV
jgi:hypothetical protein